MNTWVEYYKFTDKRNNTHAQMKESAKWVNPDPSIIQKRFFDTMKDAKEFARRMEEDGYMVSIKKDGMSGGMGTFDRFKC